MEDNILEVNRLKVSFRTNNGTVKAVRDVSFKLKRGKTLAIVGESGSGKSVTSKVILGISAPNAIIEGGEVLFDGKDIVKIGEDEMYDIRGDKIAMIFQDPLSSLDPIVRVGKQITEAMMLKNKAKRKRARKEFNKLLDALKVRMIACYQNDVNYSSEKIAALCKEFDDFNVAGIKLQNSFNDSYYAAGEILALSKEFFYIAGKKRRQNVIDYVKDVNKQIKKIEDPVFLNQCQETVDSYKAKFTEYLITYKGLTKELCPDELYKEVENIIDDFTNIIKTPRPNFFRYGYYSLHNDMADLLKLKQSEAEQVALEYLDNNFMKNFIDASTVAVKASFEEALEGKKVALEYLAKCKEYFKQANLDKKETIELAKESKEIMEKSFDSLAIKKDSVAMTFSTAFNEFVKKYFKLIEFNIKEEERVAKQTAKREALIAKGKKVDWKVTPNSAGSTDDVLFDINSLIDAITKDYENFIKSSENVDYKKMCIDLIDHFKEKASDYVYKLKESLAKEKAIKLMDEVGIPDARLRFTQYPFEFSGGMRQRIVIAIALAANPEILICDEPTTALDVTIQSQILELINKLKEERGLSIIFITHDLGVVANMADDIAVMYAGKIVEYGTAEDIFYSPAHPYTWALLSSMPDLDTKDKLDAIPGTPPNMIYPPKGDAFAARNKYALKIDFEEQPPMFKISDTHYAATWLLDPRAPKVDMPKAIKERIARMEKSNGGK